MMKRQSIKLLIVGLFLAIFSATANAEEERIKLKETGIQGNSELPKVLYIVPWKKQVIDTSPVEVDSMVDDVMQPIDREVLHRQVIYYEKGIFAE